MTDASPYDMQVLQTLAERRGIHAALGYLNARTPHRFTGIFKYVDTDQLQNVCLFDREDSKAQTWPTFPRKQSFCSVIQTTGNSFVIANALTDQRVSNHPAARRVASYCGVPLTHPDGSLYGSLCHFDFHPVPYADLDLSFLELSVPIFMRLLN